MCWFDYRAVLTTYLRVLRPFALCKLNDKSEVCFIGLKGPIGQGSMSEYVGSVMRYDIVCLMLQNHIMFLLNLCYSWFGYSINGINSVRKVVSTELQVAAIRGDINTAQHNQMMKLQVISVVAFLLWFRDFYLLGTFAQYWWSILPVLTERWYCQCCPRR